MMAKQIFTSLFKLTCIFLTILLAFYGQEALSQADILNGTLLFFVSATLLSFANWKDQAVIAPSLDSNIETPLSDHKYGQMIIIGGVSLLLVAALLFALNVLLILAWIAFLSGIALTLLPGCVKAFKILSLELSVCEKWALVFLTLLALFLRVYKLDSYPPGLWYDDATAGLTGIDIATNPSQRQIFFGEGLEQPALHFLIVSASIEFLGRTIFALRLPSALIGTLCVPLFFLFLKELLKRKDIALIGAVILAFSSWHLNFSRWCANAPFSLTFDLLALYFLLLAWRTKQIQLFIASGISIGIGINFYHISRIYAALLAVVVLLLIIFKRTKLKDLFARLSAMGIAASFVVLPIVLFALLNPEVFFKHTSELNIFKTTEDGQLLNTLWLNAKQHLLMFNYLGDAMSRHNTPGTAVLPYLTSILFVLGLCYTVLHFYSLQSLILLAGFSSLLLGGILSKPVDLPTSLRTIDSMIFVYSFCAIALVKLKDSLLSILPKVKTSLVSINIGCFVIVAFLGSENILKVLSHLKSKEAWLGFNGNYRVIAEEMNKLDLTKTTVYFPEVYVNQPTFFYLVPNFTNYQNNREGLLPLTDSTNDSLICKSANEDRTKLELYYPKAKRIEIKSEYYSEGEAESYCYLITAKDIEETQGLETKIFASNNLNKPLSTRFDNDLDISENTSEKNITIVKSGLLKVTENTPIEMRLEGNGVSKLQVGDKVLNGNGTLNLRNPIGNIPILLSSSHTGSLTPKLTIKVREKGSDKWRSVDKRLLFRSPPIDSNGLLGDYYAGENWQGDPVISRIDSDIDFYFHLHPVPQPNSITWQGYIDIPISGAYSFGVAAVDYAQVWIDNKLIVKDTNSNDAEAWSEKFDLTKGKHQLFVAFASHSGYAQMKLKWNYADQLGIVPWNVLYPADLKFDLEKLN